MASGKGGLRSPFCFAASSTKRSYREYCCFAVSLSQLSGAAARAKSRLFVCLFRPNLRVFVLNEFCARRRNCRRWHLLQHNTDTAISGTAGVELLRAKQQAPPIGRIVFWAVREHPSPTFHTRSRFGEAGPFSHRNLLFSAPNVLPCFFVCLLVFSFFGSSTLFNIPLNYPSEATQ